MRQEVLNWAAGIPCGKMVSKETLNHGRFIQMITGLDVYSSTSGAFLNAYQALGIDIINRVPLENAPSPTPENQKRYHSDKPYVFSHLGVYDTALRLKYQCECVEEIWQLNMDTISYHDLITPVPHPCASQDIEQRNSALGQIGLYYPMLYTTLFMWPVEVLGWENFMLAAALEPKKFFKHFLLPCARKSRAVVDEIASVGDSPFVFLHDDLANASGPVFAPSWYDDYIFSLYPQIFQPAKDRGKKIILVADGNMAPFFPKLIEAGIDGIMFENPATDIDSVIEHFGQTGRFFIGGIETAKLTFGTPDDITSMVKTTGEKCSRYKGFAMASCGGLHDNIPLQNLEAYFDARAQVGATPQNWRTIVK